MTTAAQSFREPAEPNCFRPIQNHLALSHSALAPKPINRSPSMTIDANDPRITAYAFGELDSEQLRAFEEELAGSKAMQQQVEETRQMIATLQQELRASPAWN